MTRRSKLYVGHVSHRRLQPKEHSLRYRVFWLLVDLDELDQLDESLRLFSHNRFNALSLHDRDHGDGSGRPLKAQILAHLDAARLETNGVSIALLCMPRLFGYVFNPLSVYFVSAPGGRTTAILYEVTNTFGERHSYLIPAQDDRTAVDQRCDKRFYVSPFLEMGLRYRFRVHVPDDRVSVAIHAADASRDLLAASLHGSARALDDRSLLRALVTHPLLTLKVSAAIHWHALRLLLKGIRMHPHPAPPRQSVSFSAKP
jgi:DUF1365 family protein